MVRYRGPVNATIIKRHQQWLDAAQVGLRAALLTGSLRLGLSLRQPAATQTSPHCHTTTTEDGPAGRRPGSCSALPRHGPHPRPVPTLKTRTARHKIAKFLRQHAALAVSKGLLPPGGWASRGRWRCGWVGGGLERRVREREWAGRGEGGQGSRLSQVSVHCSVSSLFCAGWLITAWARRLRSRCASAHRNSSCRSLLMQATAAWPRPRQPRAALAATSTRARWELGPAGRRCSARQLRVPHAAVRRLLCCCAITLLLRGLLPPFLGGDVQPSALLCGMTAPPLHPTPPPPPPTSCRAAPRAHTHTHTPNSHRPTPPLAHLPRRSPGSSSSATTGLACWRRWPTASRGTTTT